MKKTIKKHFVKIPAGRNKLWLTVDTICTKSCKQTGKSIKNGKKYSFYPSDVLAYYYGNLKEIEGLGMPYIPAAHVCNILDTIVPDSMGYETHIAARIIEVKLNKKLNEYVAEKLKYTELELCRALSAEQVDAVAMAIYNIEEKNQAIIIGDQTGIGKGRVAASIIRYGVLQGKKPIFVTEKPNLFSDMYRDLKDIGSANLKPFIINNNDAKTKVKDDTGKVIHEPLNQGEQTKIFKAGTVPANFDYVELTYSQVASSKPTIKQAFISKIGRDNIFILDESHNAGGNLDTSATALFFYNLVQSAKGVVFLSATFAKRPDNMPLYAAKTSMAEANMTNEELVEAVKKGGVALQEILSAQLVAEGQMIRRERSFEGVEVNWIALTEKTEEHKSTFDNIGNVLRGIIEFQDKHIKGIIKKMDKVAAAQGKEVEERKGTSKAGVDSQPYFSKVFQVINQILFSIKAKSVAELAVQRLDEGKKPVIAFASTMETFLNELGDVGETVDIDFRTVLQKGLDSVLRYTVIDANGDRVQKDFSISEIGEAALKDYNDLINKINQISTGISLSPIDIIKDHIRKAGYTVEEVTGRSLEVQVITETTGVLLKRKKVTASDCFRQFNNNEIDCIMINQSGSTGASAHAIPTKVVSESEVKQRVMLVLQPELDINREVQKRGRINRTGQILKPIYDYVMSVIPAEKRLMMMLRKKLKSLDANTTSNQKQSDNTIEVDDFLNKYGDKVITDYLIENDELVEKLDDPLKFKSTNENMNVIENASGKVSGRVAVLSIKEQEKFYDEITERYAEYIDYLKQAGTYDLEVEAMNLEAETLEKDVAIQGREGASVFAENTYIEKCMVNVLKKPFTKEELINILEANKDGENPKEKQARIRNDLQDYLLKKSDEDVEKLNKKYEKLISEIRNEKGYEKAQNKAEYVEYRKQILNEAQQEDIQLSRNKANSNFQYIVNYLDFYYIGKALNYPIIGNDSVKAICTNIVIDSKKSNPYTPSNIKIQIAISNSDKFISLALSGETGKLLSEIIGKSMSLSEYDDKNTIEQWTELCKKSNLNRNERYIITGNLLQGAAKFDNGKLISYTTNDGATKKGILMPESYDVSGDRSQSFVTVPIGKAVRYIKDIEQGSGVYSSDDKILILKNSDYDGNVNNYYMAVPGNKSFHKYIKDEKIIALCNNYDGFQRRSDKMIAYFSNDNIGKLIEHLDKEFSLSIMVSASIFEHYFKDEKEKGKFQKDKFIQKAEEIYHKDKQEFEDRKNNQKEFTPEQKPVLDKEKKIKIAKAKMKMLKLKF